MNLFARGEIFIYTSVNRSLKSCSFTLFLYFSTNGGMAKIFATLGKIRAISTLLKKNK